MTAARLMGILWARRVIVLVTLAGVLLGALGFATTLSKTYQGRARIMIDLAVDPTTGVKLDPRIFPLVVWTQSNLMKDPTVIINAAKRLGYMPSQDPDPRDVAAVALRNRLIRQLDRSVYVDVVPDSNILDITAFAASPAEARRIADAFRVAYINLSVQLQRSSAIGAMKVMRERLTTLMRDRTEASSQRAAFERRHAVVLAEDGADQFDDQLESIVRTDDALLAKVGRSGRFAALAQVNAAQTARLEAQLAMARTQYGPNNPMVRALEAQRTALAGATAGAAAQSAAAGSALPASTVGSLMSAQVEKVLAQRGVLAEGRMLVMREYALDNVIRGLAGRLVATAQQASVMSGGVRAVGNATEQIDPVSPNLPLIFGVAVAIGLVLGCQLALIVEFLDRRVRDPADLSGAGATVLVAVGPRGARGAVAVAEPDGLRGDWAQAA